MSHLRTLLFLIAIFLLFGAPGCPAGSDSPATGGPASGKVTDEVIDGLPKVGGFEGGNPGERVGGFEGGNPALLVIKGQFKKPEKEGQCPSVVLVDEKSVHHDATVDKSDCSFKYSKEYPSLPEASSPEAAFAIVAVADDDQWSQFKLTDKDFATFPRGTTDLGVDIPFDHEVPLSPTNPTMAPPVGQEVSLGYLFGTYSSGRTSDRSPDGLFYACPKSDEGIKIELKPFNLPVNPNPGAALNPTGIKNMVEMIIYSQVADSTKAYNAQTEKKDLFKGTMTAGYLRVISLPVIKTKPHIAECRGWIEPQDAASPGPLLLRVTCYYTPQGPVETPIAGACYYWDYLKP